MNMLEWFKQIEGGETFEGLPEGSEVPKTNVKSVAVFGFIVLFVGFFGFIAWASLTPMIKGVSMAGQVTSASQDDIITSRYGGTIRAIVAREGEKVKKGQPIMLLGDSQIKSNLGAIKGKYITYLATYARLNAEAEGKPSLRFPAALLAFKDSVHAKEAMASQMSLFNSDAADYSAQKDMLNASVSGVRGYIENARLLRKSTEKQIKLNESELVPLERLAAEGYYPKAKVIDLKNQLQQLKGRLNEETGDISREEGNLSENKVKLYNLRNSFLQKVNNQLSEVQGMVFSLQKQYEAALEQYNDSHVAAPSDGVIVKIYNKTVGGAVMPGQPVVDILPVGRGLIVQGSFPVMDAADVRKGLKADLIFPALDPTKTPVIEGRVIFVSANSIPNPVTHMQFYTCRVKIGRRGLKTLASRGLALKAGMPVGITVKTSSRSLMAAILNPLLEKIPHAILK